jgi:protocatechuate 3,4-dioxygenase beta subunit
MAALIARPTSTLAASSPLIVTPGQTEGPFYPVVLPADTDGDLVLVKGQAVQAMGQITHLSGRVLNRRGQIVAGAIVEIWQCDAHGIYNHPRAPGHASHDSGFQGFGRVQVDAAGLYQFRTIRPVAYPGRTPHIHFKVHAPGVGRLTTQLYVAGEPQNATDAVLNAIRDRAARDSVIVRFEDAPELEPGALKAAFDLVLGI